MNSFTIFGIWFLPNLNFNNEIAFSTLFTIYDQVKSDSVFIVSKQTIVPVNTFQTFLVTQHCYTLYTHIHTDTTISILPYISRKYCSMFKIHFVSMMGLDIPFRATGKTIENTKFN